MAKLKQKFEVATINNINITIDMSVFEKTNEPYFNATDMARAFEKQVYEWKRREETKEYIDALLAICPELDKKLIKTERGRHGGTYLHKALFSSFIGWCDMKTKLIYDDFCYQSITGIVKDKKSPKEVENILRFCNQVERKDLFLYVLLSDLNTVKIGVSEDVEKRIAVIQPMAGVEIIKKTIFGPTDRDIALKIEKEIHSSLKEYSRKGEWFDVDYQKAVVVSRHAYIET